MRIANFPLWVSIFTICCIGSFADDMDYAGQIETARRDFDADKLQGLQAELENLVADTPGQYDYQFLISQAALYRADMLRNQRMIADLNKRDAKTIQKTQVDIAEAAVPFAKRALDLADSENQTVEASRVLGELYAHRITGMVSGMKYGGKSKDLIENALKLKQDDPESLRANGLMFLYNPPISGGNVSKAIETFTKCIDLDPESDVHLMYLAQAWRKKGERDRANEAAEAALALNPNNMDAAALIGVLGVQDQ